MSQAGRVTVARSLLALALGTGVCYCVYRALCTRGKKHVNGGGILDRVSGMTVRAGVNGGSPETKSENIPKPAGDLEAHHLQTLLHILSSCSHSSTQEQILVTLCNSAAFSANHDIIRNFNGIHIIGESLSHSNPRIKTGALNALNNLSMNLQNQEQIQVFLIDILKDIKESTLNSEVQLAGLRLVVNMSVTDNYHEKLEESIPSLLGLVDKGNNITKIHVLKILVNLSANPLMTIPLLASKAPASLIFLFDRNINRDVLIRVLTFAANLSENLVREQQDNRPCSYKEDSLYGTLFEDPAVLQGTILQLLLFSDMEIKEQVNRCIRNVERLKH
ncbi:armadillo repeat-containing protein 10 isoform X1 [Dendropsophus ebraccatus]|uniref:armadillo repeat-containing protein 10 isoform X1 n=1 Tax=Dendropsophus ebraccatus TaxID=150705 RepID=UPI003831A67E